MRLMLMFAIAGCGGAGLSQDALLSLNGEYTMMTWTCSETDCSTSNVQQADRLGISGFGTSETFDPSIYRQDGDGLDEGFTKFCGPGGERGTSTFLDGSTLTLTFDSEAEWLPGSATPTGVHLVLDMRIDLDGANLIGHADFTRASDGRQFHWTLRAQKAGPPACLPSL